MMALEPLVRQLVSERLDALLPRGEMDLVTELLFEVPAYVLFELFGVPRSELPNVRRFVTRLAVLGFGQPDDATQVTMAEGLADFLDYCRGHVTRLIENPGNNAISEFIDGLRDPVTGAPPEADYVATVTFQLFFAGHETTVNATAGGVRALLENRAQWEALCADPALIPNAVEECLRYAPSVPAWRRVLRENVTLSGVEIPAGARLLVAIGSANRDEAHFVDGERFDIRRENAREHLGFGYGRHHCLGADLARMEMRVILEELTRRVPELALVPGQTLQYSANTSHRGPEHLRVSWPT
jgi:cytochrome P450